ncbi:MAG: GGDEF domain-containing protein [Desulfuromonadaceae bacterium]|nr:GGDEF domain-containing protein [Desulfuromonadaceae bacterium]
MYFSEQLKKFYTFFESKSWIFNFFIGLACSLVVILLDVTDNQEYQFSFFYMFPIGFTTWFAGRYFGGLLALICSFAWAIDNHTHLSLALIWNTFSTIGVFLTISILVSKVKNMWESEHQQSRNDFLTGVFNARAFQEILIREINRLDHNGIPFSLAYIDLDNFKEVNDRFGHTQGDQLLKLITRSLIDSLRKSDVIARMGGDEFVVLLPGTNLMIVQDVLNKMQNRLQKVLRGDRWQVTCSIGVVTCLAKPLNYDELISMADDLMYRVKQNGKNNIQFAQYPPA